MYIWELTAVLIAFAMIFYDLEVLIPMELRTKRILAVIVGLGILAVLLIEGFA